MRLFDDEAPKAVRSGSDWEYHRRARQPHVGPAQDEVGVLAMSSFVLARTGEVAVAVRGITAFSDGLMVHVVVLFADEQRREHLDWSLKEHSRSPGRFRVGVQMPDGSRATTGAGDSPPVENLENGAVMTLLGSSIGTLRWQGDYWLWPLPADGSMVVGCSWPDKGIDESLVAVDTADLRVAAKASGPVWTQ